MHLGTTLDGFFPVKASVTLETSRESRVRFHEAADGGRTATVFGGLAAARTWAAGYGAVRPGELDLLESMAADAAWYRRGTGLQFLPTGGQRVNMLSREESSLAYLEHYMPAPVRTEHGVVLGYSAGPRRAAVVGEGIPLPVPASGAPRCRLTASAYARGRTTLLVRYRDAARGVVAEHRAVATGGASTFDRIALHCPEAPPAPAVHADLLVTGEFTRPAVTLGPELYAWGEGQRVPSVVVEQNASALLWAGSRCLDAATYARPAYTITELRTGDPA
ncbi:hypothetical protein NBM05_08470 [Rothia sp. AR01]|uniref:Uncharacterized protein n=1 Tax=Rothia santali TaxID=2949643 RepID=A0A9X2HDC7_9MICC|nr:hypothetical protein [Rothia santali]MCP3426035.1 hypothetical protein [Rothia santali]